MTIEVRPDQVDLVELNTGGKSLRMRIDKLAIEFGIIKGKNGEFMAYNVTLPGGTPITQEAIEHRQEEGAGQRYSGVIQWWHRWQGWGHILPDPGCTFPAAVQQKLDETASQAAAKAKSEEKGKEKLLYFRKDDCEWNLRTEIGKKVTFAVYLDDKGAGAKDVAPVEGCQLSGPHDAYGDAPKRKECGPVGRLGEHPSGTSGIGLPLGPSGSSGERSPGVAVELFETGDTDEQKYTCTGVEEEGVRWDVIRSELRHALREVHHGALARDLHAAKDSKGRDPAVSYGDVQLQRHLERFQKLVLVLPERSRCPLGRHCLRVLVSVLYSGLPWNAWFVRYEALAAGWPVFEVMGLVADLYGGEIASLPENCDVESLAQLEPLIGQPEQLTTGLDVGFLAQTQTAVRLVAGRHTGGPKAIFTPPLPQLLLRVEQANQKYHRAWMRQGECLIHFQLQETDAGHRAPECFEHYRSVGQALQSLRPMASWTTLLVSSGTWTWTEDLAHDLRRLLHERHQAAREVDWAGLATINSSRIFNWRRVTHKYWKLAYEEYATGHETSPFLPLAQFWAVGDTTSGTRVYGTKSFVGLMRRLAEREREYVPSLPGFASGAEDWLVMLDLLGKEMGLRAYTYLSHGVLNLYRSGETELFPWDADIDANFIASHPVVIGDSVRRSEAIVATSPGYSYILRGDRVVFRTLEDTARMDIWISGPQEVRAYDIRARLCGLRVNFFRDQLMGAVWYYRPGEKIYGHTRGQLLHCQWRQHNACLPDCVRNGLGVGQDGCEFSDRFVHLFT
ncbi:Uncharacterized protein SCF082_LOCUS40210 [Durusdinium trenchii]|uniref:Uncharacterized protein n=1 Tax=Durusdinium trenchii TaxID=1381693 RepID=A0ABP0Q979_9DINO